MAMNLNLYLKRTGQSLGDWLTSRDISTEDAFLNHCNGWGLIADQNDLESVKQILDSRKPVTMIDDQPQEKRQKKKKTRIDDV